MAFKYAALLFLAHRVATIGTVVSGRGATFLVRPCQGLIGQTEDDDSFPRLRADVCVQAANFDAEDIANNRLQHRSTVIN
jgi:hypothetical protein